MGKSAMALMKTVGYAGTGRFKNDCIVTLQNRIEKGGIHQVDIYSRGMNILKEKGIDYQERQVDLINSTPSITDAIDLIRKDKQNHWGNGMFDSCIFIPNRFVTEPLAERNKGTITFGGIKQKVTINQSNNVILHGFGFDDNYAITGIYSDPALNYASVTARASFPSGVWFSPLLVTQRITLWNGVTTREVMVENMGNNLVPMSVTTHGYFKFHPKQTREGILLDLPGKKHVRTITQPFIKDSPENLLPDLSQYPFADFVSNPAYKSLFDGPVSKRFLGDAYFDHCIVGLVPEGVSAFDNAGTKAILGQYAARFYQPAVGWGAEVSTPVVKDVPNSVNALQLYSPPKGAAAYGCMAFEFQANVMDALNIQWADYSLKYANFPSVLNYNTNLFTPGGMRVLFPFGNGEASMMKHVVRHKMISEMPMILEMPQG